VEVSILAASGKNRSRLTTKTKGLAFLMMPNKKLSNSQAWKPYCPKLS